MCLWELWILTHFVLVMRKLTLGPTQLKWSAGAVFRPFRVLLSVQRHVAAYTGSCWKEQFTWAHRNERCNFNPSGSAWEMDAVPTVLSYTLCVFKDKTGT